MNAYTSTTYSMSEAESGTESDTSESDEDNTTFETLPTTEVLVSVRNKLTGDDELFRALLDSGTGRSLATYEAACRTGMLIKPSRRKHKYRTAIGTFATTQRITLRAHKLEELSSKRELSKAYLQVANTSFGNYDFIFGRDYMQKYGIDLRFSNNTIEWDGVSMEMHEPDYWTTERMEAAATMIGEPDMATILNDESYLQQILDSKYEKQDLLKVSNAQEHLTVDQRRLLEQTLMKHELLFSGTLGEWPDLEVDVELKPGSKPYHCQRPYRIPHFYLETLKKEVDRLVQLGVLEEAHGDSPWAAPSFIIPKKDQRVRFITDFRELNKCIERKPWPMPHITEVLQDIGHYTYVTALDLSMGYYHFRLSDALADMCTFMLPFGKYKYRRLPMGLNISPDFFQRCMTQLFGDLSFVICYLDDIAIITDGSYEDHMEKLDIVLERLKSRGLQVNGLKSFWVVKEVEYLGFILTPEGLKPQPKKVEAIRKLAPPTTRRQLRHFIGMVNFYRYMWRHRSHVLEPLTRLTSKKVKYVWTAEQQHAFEEMKRIISKEVLLSFPDYTKPFHLYTDSSDYQLGAVLMQENKPIAFYSRKLTPTQQKYSVGEKEMLSIVETLGEFCNILFGYPVVIHTDHANFTHDTRVLKNARVMRWRMAIEEFMPSIEYVPGEKNVVADALSRLSTSDDVNDETSFWIDDCFENCFDMSRPARDFAIPLDFRTILKEQLKDTTIQKLQRETPHRLGRLFDNVGRREGDDEVITIKDPTTGMERVVVPKALQPRLMKWYHTMLVHPGVTRMYNTLHQHFTWQHMQRDIAAYLKPCHECQLGKRGGQSYGKIPLKDVETKLWADICVDLAGPWKATINNEPVTFHALTIVDPFTSWVEIIPIRSKTGQHVCDLIEQEWFRRYPRPSRVIFDQGGEFDNRWFHNLLRTWHIRKEPITVKNPTANAIVERLHRIMGDMLCVQLATQHEHEDPIRDMLSAAAYGIRATVHGTTLCTPGQLVFQKDMILRTHVEANIEFVRERRKAAIAKTNVRENKRRIAHRYQPGGSVLLLPNPLDPKMTLNRGPFKIVSVNRSNGILRIQRGNYVEPIHIRHVRPYFGRSSGGD